MKAVIKNGAICPQEPVPAEWIEGTELEVARADAHSTNGNVDKLDQWLEELQKACAELDSDDDRTLRAAVLEATMQEKELARREAGLE
ncbi:MAG TPA: hypothetical protein VFE62_20750 [Gemmataceae bacterium]|nr:hypothetical protein [Gemmataceae bacterium]